MSLDVTFTDGSDRVAGISINGTVSEGGVTVSVNPIGYDDLAGYASGLDCVGLGGVDVSLTRVSGFQIIKVPFVSDGSMFVGAADAYYIDEGELVPVVCRVMGEEVWIYTDHNTPYMVVVTEIAGSPVFEDDPTVDPEPEIPPLPFPDDSSPNRSGGSRQRRHQDSRRLCGCSGGGRHTGDPARIAVPQEVTSNGASAPPFLRHP